MSPVNRMTTIVLALSFLSLSACVVDLGRDARYRGQQEQQRENQQRHDREHRNDQRDGRFSSDDRGDQDGRGPDVSRQ